MEPNPSARDRIMQLAYGYQPACVLGTAAELDLFSRIGEGRLTAAQLAAALEADARATAMLADALCAIGVLSKREGRYSVTEEFRPFLLSGTPQTVVPMLQHLMNVTRAWAMLGWTVKAGIPAPRTPSTRGPAADRASFIAAMHSASGPMADQLVAKLGPPQFEHLLDVGGASGTWTIALLRGSPGARATIFDLPDAVTQARDRFAAHELADRVDFAPGDFYRDPLPGGADFAWVSAIMHQHSRRHNRELFAKVFAALKPGGRVAVRDVVMDPDRTSPRMGAMFAINMLANTQSGGTFTFEEIAGDLMSAGFAEPELAVRAEDMNSVVTAVKMSSAPGA